VIFHNNYGKCSAQNDHCKCAVPAVQPVGSLLLRTNCIHFCLSLSFFGNWCMVTWSALVLLQEKRTHRFPGLRFLFLAEARARRHFENERGSSNSSDLQSGQRIRDWVQVWLSNFKTATFSKLSFLPVVDQWKRKLWERYWWDRSQS